MEEEKKMEKGKLDMENELAEMQVRQPGSGGGEGERENELYICMSVFMRAL